MFEFLQQVADTSGPDRVPILVVLFTAIAGVSIFSVFQVRRFLTQRMEFDAKREMIARGMSADEIERVLQASSEPRES